MTQYSRRMFLKQATYSSGAIALGASTETAAGETENPCLKVALLQMHPDRNNQIANLKKGDRFCRQAAAMGADIALMPEIWSIGYTRFQGTDEAVIKEWQAQAVPRNGEFVAHFAQLAKTLNMAIAVTYLEAWDGPPRNSVSLIDRFGNMRFTYAKVHTSDFKPMETSCTPGDGFYVEELDTAKGIVHVGAMICFDREAPESARILMLKGAELILTPNACGLDSMRIDQFKTRAFENALAVAMTNYPEPNQNGHSVAFDAKGKLAVEAGEKEGIYFAHFDLDEIRKHRQKTIWGNAYRRPHRYHALIETEKEEIFQRKNGYGKEFIPEKR